MFVVDTSVLVYAANENAAAHRECRDMIEAWRFQRSAWYTTWGVIYEFLRIVSHPRILRAPWTASKSWEFVDAILASPAIGILVETDRQAGVADHVFREIPHLSGNLLHDAHTAILMRENGIRRIFTRDTDFHRFPFLEVIDPLQAAAC